MRVQTVPVTYHRAPRSKFKPTGINPMKLPEQSNTSSFCGFLVLFQDRTQERLVTLQRAVHMYPKTSRHPNNVWFCITMQLNRRQCKTLWRTILDPARFLKGATWMLPESSGEDPEEYYSHLSNWWSSKACCPWPRKFHLKAKSASGQSFRLYFL